MQALSSIEALEEPAEAAAVLAYRVTRVQGFAEGNKRTALLFARWVLDHNGVDGHPNPPTPTATSPICWFKHRQGSTSRPT